MIWYVMDFDDRTKVTYMANGDFNHIKKISANLNSGEYLEEQELLKKFPTCKRWTKLFTWSLLDPTNCR